MSQVYAPNGLRLVNEFFVERVDLATFDFPEVEVIGSTLLWSADDRLGNYSVRAKGRTDLVLAQVEVRKGQPQAPIRHELRDLADEWNDDPRAHWLPEIRRAVEYVHAHHVRQITEQSQKAEKTAAMLVWLDENSEVPA